MRTVDFDKKHATADDHGNVTAKNQDGVRLGDMIEHGWVLQSKLNGRFSSFGAHSEQLKYAPVLGTRDEARFYKGSAETVLKVRLNEHGEPTEIIGRG